MQILQSLIPAHPVTAPFIFAVQVYGIRFLLFAGLAFLLAHPKRERGIGRPHEQTPATFNTALHVKRELMHSIFTVLMFGLVNAVLFGYGFISASFLYFNVSAYPIWWLWLSIPLMLILHDTLFYWLHRAMHTQLLYGSMHRVHHLSIYPTAFAAYSFHPYEALAEALIVTAILYILPVHPFAFMIFQTISTAYNVYGHCGRELYPKSMATHWLGRWLNTSTLHSQHHLKGHGNYGFYFTFWDRAMGTLESSDRRELMTYSAADRA